MIRLAGVILLFLPAWALRCPDKCACIGDSEVRCANLTAGECNLVFSELAHPEWTTSLMRLSITRSGLDDLSKFPAFDNIEYDASESNCRVLRYLDLSNNDLREFNTPRELKFPSVKVLDLRMNNFEHLKRDAFLMFVNAEEIYLGGNGMRDVDWEAFRLFRLRKLHLNNNYLEGVNEHVLRFAQSLEDLNLSGNQLVRIQSSDFFSAQRLKILDLSRNRIRIFIYDSFSPLYQVGEYYPINAFQLEELNLAANNLSAIPGGDLRQLMGLRVLNMSANPFTSVAAGDLILSTLQILDISRCPELRVVEAAAFSNVPSIHTVDLSHNPRLAFISPRAFENNSLVFSVDLSHSGLHSISGTLLSAIAQVRLTGNPFDCGCMREVMDGVSTTTIVDWADAECITMELKHIRLSQLSWSSLSSDDNCRPAVVIPFGDELTAEIGETFSMHCSARNEEDVVEWKFPNQSTAIGTSSTVTKVDKRADFTSTLLRPGWEIKTVNRERVVAAKEMLRFDVLIPTDEGIYECTVKRSKHTSTRRLSLKLVRPPIRLYTLEIASHYASLAWNDSLRVSAVDRVRLYLHSRDSEGRASRSVQLSLHNPWFSYNVMRLRPDQNYTFCLVWTVVDGSTGSISGSDFNAALTAPPLSTVTGNSFAGNPANERAFHEVCTQARTTPSLSFWSSLSMSTICSIIGVFTFVCLVLSFRSLYVRLHVWQQAKYRSRMNQSISGQSFLSRSSSNGVGSNSNQSITYENQLQLSQSASLCRFPSTSSSSAATTDGHNHLLTVEDMAL